jgi:cobalamin biosynthesis protein CobD/CbiB
MFTEALKGIHFVVLVGRLIAFSPSLIETYRFQCEHGRISEIVVVVVVFVVCLFVHPYSYIVTLDLPITISHHIESSI